MINKTASRIFLLMLFLLTLSACSSSNNNTTGNQPQDTYPPWDPINIACLYCLTNIPIGTLVPAHLGPNNLWDRPGLQAEALDG